MGTHLISHMKTFTCIFLFATILSCKTPVSEPVAQDTVLDEYADWYTLKSPVDYQLKGVWGDYNKTVLISTGDKLFRTTDQGKNWQQVHKQSIGMMGFVQHQDTLFTMSGLSSRGKDKAYQQFLVQADNFSTDDGKTWHKYTGRNPVLRDIPEELPANKFLVDPIRTRKGEVYRINKVFEPGNNTGVGTFETPGVVSSLGARIDLPQLHQLQSLYLDEQQRLYINASDAVCQSGYPFKFCNSVAGRGVVFISKKPLL